MSNPDLGRILVTGGTGFIGRYVVDRLVADGHRPVITTFKKHKHPKEQIDVEELDLTDRSQVNSLIDRYSPQVVLHLAGVTPGHSDPSGSVYREVNFNGTVNLLNALNEKLVTRVVLLGSAAEYGDQQIPFEESSPAQPVSAYGLSKADANNFGLEMHATRGLPLTVLRVFTAFGFGQPDKMFLSQLITHALLNRHFKMSDGEQKRDFVYVEDVAQAVTAAITAEQAVGRVINIAGGKGVALKKLARQVWEICGADPEFLEIGAREKRGDDTLDTEADISLAAKLLNWHPGEPILTESAVSSKLIETIHRMQTSIASAAK